MRKRGGGVLAAALLLLLPLAFAWPSVSGKGKADVGGRRRMLQVGMTLVPGAEAKGAVCLDGSPPAYHLHRGFGTGAGNWLLQFEGGGWCNDVASCLLRSHTGHGSSRFMRKVEYFSGILSDDPSQNPDFYNWNRVKLRYCDGASFGGDSFYINDTMRLHFRGQRIWEAIILDLLPKGLAIAKKALLSGCSAGGLATFLHCDDLRRHLPPSATVKCLSDAGFFLDVADIVGNYTMRSFFDSVVALQGVQRNLHANCTRSRRNPQQCFFPQHALPYIRTPYFILNAAYDVYQFHHIFVPPYADPRGRWNSCKRDPAACNPDQISVLHGYRNQMLIALRSPGCLGRGFYINSCFAHCQSELQDTWFAPDSPRIHNMAEVNICVLFKLEDFIKAAIHYTENITVLPLAYGYLRQLPRPLVIGTSREEMLQKLTVPILAILLATTPYHRNLRDAPLKEGHLVFLRHFKQVQTDSFGSPSLIFLYFLA